MDRLPFVSVIIVNWNGASVLNICLDSLISLTYPNWELIIVDNGSDDKSLELIERLKKNLKAKRVIILKNKINKGFAIANNQGFKKSKGEYILLLNNDTKITPPFLNILIKEMQSNRNIGITQPKIHVLDNPELLDNCGSFLTNTGFLEHWGFLKKDKKEFNKKEFVFSVKGACMLIRREVILKVGLFDEDFVSYFEETDFCWKAWIAGWQVMYMPFAEVYHKIGYSSKKQSQVFVNYHSIKNRIVSIGKNFEVRNLITIGILHILLISCLGIYYLSKLQIRKSGMIWKALFWNLINLKKTLQKRNKIQKLRTVQDKDLFRFIMKNTDWKEMFLHFRKVEANFA